MTATADQIRKIHALARNAGLDEESRRDFMEREVSCRSTKDMNVDQAIKVIDRLKVLAGDRAQPAKRKAPPKSRGALALDGPYVAVVRALWISGYELGLIRDKTDAAMVAFVERQTGIQNMTWLRHAGNGTSVIEALKKWLARDAGVVWAGEEQDGRGRKLAVYLALRRPLTAAGVEDWVALPGRHGCAYLGEAQLDALIRAGGARLRQAKEA